MKIILTLDYELFLGAKTGSVRRCLINPLEAYIPKIGVYDAKFTIFVDATYLCALKKYGERYDCLKTEYDEIVAHLQHLEQDGHEIQLHIHPHWFYSTYDGTQWVLDQNHYKLSDLPGQEAEKLFGDSVNLLRSIVKNPITSFRAGGFSSQPTGLLTSLFARNGIVADSSVCPGNSYDSPQQQYDYSNVPDKCIYRFDSDICIEDRQGRFIEIPITTHRIMPFFYWKLVVNRLLNQEKHRVLGDGYSVKTSKTSIFKRLTRPVFDMATIDGLKISCLKDAYKRQKLRGCQYMCVLGHPKLATKYSIDSLAAFCRYVKEQGDEFITISQTYE